MNWLMSFFIDKTFGASRNSRWDDVRKKHIIEHPKCAVCGKIGKLLSNEVHHILPFWKHPELELEPTNLITLCRTHHFEWGHFFDWSSWNENIALWVGDIINKP